MLPKIIHQRQAGFAPSNTIIVGMTGCGKTHYLLKLLETKKKMYKNIYIICPALRFNRTYLDWKHINNHGVHKICCSQENVGKTIQKIPNLGFELLSDELFMSDLKGVVGRLTPWIPCLGLLSGAATFGKDFVEHRGSARTNVNKEQEDSEAEEETQDTKF